MRNESMTESLEKWPSLGYIKSCIMFINRRKKEKRRKKIGVDHRVVLWQGPKLILEKIILNNHIILSRKTQETTYLIMNICRY